MSGYPGGFGYQSPSLPPMSPFPTPFPQDMGAFGPLAYMALQGSGMLPPNLMNFSFTPSTDVFNQFQTIRQFQDKNLAMTMATKGDIQTLMKYQESIARVTGADWTKLQGRAQAASSWIGSMLPVLSMVMPEQVDMMMGPQGSQTVMAGQLANASRFMYDPSNGRMGMSGAETGKLSSALYQQLYGTDALTMQMRGIGAGRAGILTNEMLARGLMSGSPFLSGGDRPDANFANVAALVGGGGGMNGLGGLAAMGTTRLDSSKTAQMGEQIKGMAKVVSAISDLFGANGQPNAPMPQLLAALDQLGQGAEYRYSTNQVESMFRNLQQATVTGRISLPQISQMVGQNAAMISSMGGDPRDAIAMTQRSVNYAAGSANVFSSPFYGKLDPRTLAATSASLEAAGMNSPAGQMAQIAMYLSDGIDKNSGFGQLVGALKTGATTFGGGRSVLSALQGNNLRELYGSSGGVVSNFDSAAANPEVARRFTGDVAPTIRRLQFVEASQMAAGYMGGDMGSIFGISGAGDRLAVGTSLIDKVFAQGGKFAAMNPAQQAAEIEKLAANSVAGITGMTEEAALKRVTGHGKGILANMTGAMSQFTGYDLQKALQLFSPEMFQQEAGRTTANRVNADISSALGDFGRYSFSQRLTSELQNMKPGEDISNVLSRVMGGIDKGKLGQAIKDANVKGIGGIGMSIEAIRAGNPEAIKILETQMRGLGDAMKANGIDINNISDGMSSSSRFGKALDSLGTGIEMLANPAGSLLKGMDMMRPLANKAGNHLTMTIKGTLTTKADGTATLEGSGHGDGVAVGGAKGGA